MYNIRYYCQILMKLEFCRNILENTQISNFMKIRPVGSEFFPCEETDMTKPITAFRNSANVSKNRCTLKTG